MGKRRTLILTLTGVLSATLVLLVLLPIPASAAGVEEVEEGLAENLEREAGEIEAELAGAPRSEALLAELTKTRVEAADALVADGVLDSEKTVEQMKGQLALADRAWSRYLKVARKPSAELAELVAPALFRRAELAKTPHEALRRVKPTVTAQEIVVEDAPSAESWSLLSFYELFAQRYDAADEAVEKALADTKTASERASLEKKFKEVEKDARRFGRELKPGK